MADDSGAFQDFEARGWDEVAAGYAASSVVAGLTGQAATEMIRAVGPDGGRRILDLACGPGLASREAAALGAEVVGVDISAGMVDVAIATVPGAEFRQAPAEALPFETGEFDGVMCGFGLPHFAEPEAVFAETLRVLRPAGRMAFTTWCAPDKVPFFGLVFTAVFEHGNLDVPLPDGPDMFRFADEDQATTTLAGIGFGEITVEELPLRAPLDDPSQAMDLVSRATVRTRALFEAQTPEAQAAIAAAVTDAVSEMQEGGEGSVPMPAMLITATRP